MIRVFILADIRLYREGLALVFERAPSITVVGSAADWRTAAARVAALAPDIVLLDMATPDRFDAADGILALSPAPRIVGIAVPDGEDEVLAVVEAGISGYVTRADSIATTIHAIESVARGELLTTPRIAAALLRRVRALTASAPTAYASRLTPREHEIAELLGDGHSNKVIAQRLHIAPTTVKNHVHNILEKLKVSRRGDAATQLRGLQRSVPAQTRDSATD